MNYTLSQLSNINILHFKITNQENKEKYIILLVRLAQKLYLRMNTHRVGKHFEICLNKNSFDLLLISFVFCTRNSLEN